MTALLGWLASQGLGLVRDAVITKGTEFVEQKLGVKLPTKPEEMTLAKSAELMQLQFQHEEFLVNAALAEKKLDLEAQNLEQQEVTKRWQSDMSSDSWLSKNIRPLALIYVSIAVLVLALGDKWLQLRPEWIDLFKAAWLTVLGGYFLLRGGEKITSMVTKMKEKANGSRS